jgi:DNA-binding FadR family transcriptional regulator
MSDAESSVLYDGAGWKTARRSRDPASSAQPKKAEDLAHRIETEVMGRGWPVGQSLGSEPQLIEQYGVSRAVLREAVRILEHHGVARMRRGPGGGLIVTAPDLLGIQRPATLYLDYADVSPADIRAVRTSLEVTAVEAVTRTMTPHGARRLKDLLEREGEVGVDGLVAGPSPDFHVLIAQLSGNPALLLFIETLVSLTFERTLHKDFDHEQLRGFHESHGQIMQAMLAGDVDLAKSLMQSHMEESLRHVSGRRMERPLAALKGRV